ncbi:MAG: SCP2 sterol-binding domain-containing protein [Pseudomonadota bacterium]
MTLDDIVDLLSPKITGKLQGSASLDVTDLGSIRLTEAGASVSCEAADVTLSADSQTLMAIVDGSQNPMMAYMSGKLKVDGSIGRALKISELLTG